MNLTKDNILYVPKLVCKYSVQLKEVVSPNAMQAYL